MFGGFITINDSLEGMGTDTTRKQEIKNLVINNINEIETASQKPSFERARFDFSIHEMFGIKIGMIRNTFGLWDDYTLFRNMSLIKTDPITLGVPLRRTDLGILIYGNLVGKYLTYEAGFLTGENAFINRDSNNPKDLLVKLGSSFYRIDLGVAWYVHNLSTNHETPYALGFHFRYRITRDFTMLGEFVYMNNKDIDVLTLGGYLQTNLNFSRFGAVGLRWNVFIEMYHSDLLMVDLEPNLDYALKGSYIQISTGLMYALNGYLDFGFQVITGLDEEGTEFLKMALKIDAKY